MTDAPKCLELVLRMSDGTEIVFDTSACVSLHINDNRDVRRTFSADNAEKAVFTEHGRVLALVAKWEGQGVAL